MTDRARQPLRPPRYDRTRIVPGIVHLGLGGFHRAHMARYLHDLMAVDPAACDWGIVAAGLRADDRPLIDALTAQDCLYTLRERDGAGEVRTVIGSIVAAIDAVRDPAALAARLDDTATRIVSLTVTEHGYCLDRATRRLDPAHPDIVHDLAHPASPRSAIGILVAALDRRRRAGRGGFTVLSCDNMPHNGAVVGAAVLDFAGRVDPTLPDWIAAQATFPNAMVDRITPRPDPAAIAAFAAETGTADAASLVCEPFRQWVVEDGFAAGRPALDRVGVQFVPDVAPYERMKLRLLNASHLALAGPGELAGLTGVAETIGRPAVARFVAELMEHETGPTLAPVPGIDLAAYRRSVIDRFANPAIPDTVARINADAPLNYLLDPLRDRLAAGEPVDRLAFALAAWLRRVRGTDDRGAPIAVVHPLADELRRRAEAGGADPRPLLALAPLFGDLGTSAPLVAATARALAAICERGAMAALETL